MLALLGGIAAFMFGLYDRSHFVPRAALCNSGFGQLGQAMDPSVSQGCSAATTFAPWAWYLIVGGALAAVGGLADALGSLALLTSWFRTAQPAEQATGFGGGRDWKEQIPAGAPVCLSDACDTYGVPTDGLLCPTCGAPTVVLKPIVVATPTGSGAQGQRFCDNRECSEVAATALLKCGLCGASTSL